MSNRVKTLQESSPNYGECSLKKWCRNINQNGSYRIFCFRIINQDAKIILAHLYITNY